MWPILTRLGDYEIGTFGVLVGLAVLAGLWLARQLGKRDGLEPKKVNDLGLAMMASGLVGAKLLGLLVAVFSGAELNWQELRNAGAVHGGLAFGAVTGYLLARHYKISVALALDAIAPGVTIGQAIGRFGCLAAGCCFGTESSVPWAVHFSDPRAAELGGVPLNIGLHPVQLYDAGVHIALCLALVALHRKGLFRGRLFGVWSIAEGILRFSVETFRGDLGRGVWFELPWLSTGRVTALAFAALGIVVLFASKFTQLPKAQSARELK